MTFFDRAIMVMAALYAYVAYENAKEAHRHTHELACYMQDTNLCKFHEDTTQ